MTGSSRRPAAIRWRCWSWQRDERSRAGRWLRVAAHGNRCPVISRTTTCGGCGRCPTPTQRLMLLAAADPTGDATLAVAGGRTLGVGREAAAAAASEQLLEIGARVRFRHPLVRSAAYAAGSPQDRRAAHRALAEATDAQADPDRRVWHLAAAATGPDEDVAAELERGGRPGPSPRRAGGGGGVPPAVGGVDRRAGGGARTAPWRPPTPTCTPARSTPRSACWREAEAAAVDDLQRARVEQLRGQVDRGLQLRARGAGPAAAGGQEARVARCPARAGHLSRRVCSPPSSPVASPNPAAICSRSAEAARRPRRPPRRSTAP